MPLFRRSSIPWDRRFPQPAFPPTNVLFFPPSALAVLPSTLSLRFFGARRVYITRLPRQRGFDSIRFITRSLQRESGQCKSPVVSLLPIIGTRGTASRKKIRFSESCAPSIFEPTFGRMRDTRYTTGKHESTHARHRERIAARAPNCRLAERPLGRKHVPIRVKILLMSAVACHAGYAFGYRCPESSIDFIIRSRLYQKTVSP